MCVTNDDDVNDDDVNDDIKKKNVVEDVEYEQHTTPEAQRHHHSYWGGQPRDDVEQRQGAVGKFRVVVVVVVVVYVVYVVVVVYASSEEFRVSVSTKTTTG